MINGISQGQKQNCCSVKIKKHYPAMDVLKKSSQQSFNSNGYQKKEEEEKKTNLIQFSLSLKTVYVGKTFTPKQN